VGNAVAQGRGKGEAMNENQKAVMPRPAGAICSTGINKSFLVSYSSDICRDITMVNVPNAGPEVTCESIRQNFIDWLMNLDAGYIEVTILGGSR